MTTLTSRLVLFVPLLLLALPAAAAKAQTVDEKLRDIEDRWAGAVYDTTGRQQAKALSDLLRDTRKFASSHRSSPEAAAWHGIIARECIRTHCKTGTTKLRKEARDALLKAESLDPFALGGRIYANLGALYSQTSSKFGGFGSEVKGIGYLWRAIVIDPDCLESNYLYAELLVGEKKLAEARDVLLKVSETPVRSDHLRADIGRRQQILTLLHKLEKRLEKQS